MVASLRTGLLAAALATGAGPAAFAATYTFNVTLEGWSFDWLDIYEIVDDGNGGTDWVERYDLASDTAGFLDLLLTDPEWAHWATLGRARDTLFFGLLPSQTAQARLSFTPVPPDICPPYSYNCLNYTLEELSINGIAVSPARYLREVSDDGTDVGATFTDTAPWDWDIWIIYELRVTGQSGSLEMIADWGGIDGQIGPFRFYGYNPVSTFSVANFTRLPDPAPVPLPMSGWMLLLGLGGLGSLRYARRTA